MDPRLLRAQLYSGSDVPGGGPYPTPRRSRPLASRTLDAAFNAGFKMQDANGGYYTDHRLVLPLRKGAASLVTYRDGSATVRGVGSAGGDVAAGRLGPPEPRPHRERRPARARAARPTTTRGGGPPSAVATRSGARASGSPGRRPRLRRRAEPHHHLARPPARRRRRGPRHGARHQHRLGAVLTYRAALGHPVNGANGVSLLPTWRATRRGTSRRGGSGTSTRCRFARRPTPPRSRHSRRRPRPPQRATSGAMGNEVVCVQVPSWPMASASQPPQAPRVRAEHLVAADGEGRRERVGEPEVRAAHRRRGDRGPRRAAVRGRRGARRARRSLTSRCRRRRWPRTRAGWARLGPRSRSGTARRPRGCRAWRRRRRR